MRIALLQSKFYIEFVYFTSILKMFTPWDIFTFTRTMDWHLKIPIRFFWFLAQVHCSQSIGKTFSTISHFLIIHQLTDWHHYKIFSVKYGSNVLIWIVYPGTSEQKITKAWKIFNVFRAYNEDEFSRIAKQEIRVFFTHILKFIHFLKYWI